MQRSRRRIRANQRVSWSPVSMTLFSIAFLATAASMVLAQTTDSVAREAAGFGTIGDGIADDTIAIQRAIDSGTASIRFPPGSYRVTRPIAIELDKTGFVSLAGDGVVRILMDGAGPAFRFIGTHEGTAAPESFQEKVWDHQRAPMIDGLEIVGLHPDACGVEAQGTMQLTLTRLVVRHTRHAVHLVNRNRNVLIANCHFYENRGVGLFLDNVDLHQINVNACHLSYNDQGGIVSRQGNVRNLHISGCDIESNMSPDTPATANVLIDCSGSAHGTAEVAITGCTIQHNSQSPNSANIRILGRGNDKPEQSVVRWGNVTISGNVLSDVDTNVHLRDCRGVTLNGNTFWMGYSYNLLVEDSTDIAIGSNNLDRNPSYAYGTAKQSKNAVVFRKCEDCTINGLHVSNVHRSPAAVLLERCRRFNFSSSTILDSDGPGLLLRDVSHSLISGCLIRDDREEREACVSLRIEGGHDNAIVNNALAHGSETAAGVSSSEASPR